ncbi:MAG: hypothetical protein IKW34_02310, partial [Clostridia bacterium]|nr:hypothetical protein [Clostridia bacterium]
GFTDVTFKGQYYADFICEDNKIPCGRDFTIQCKVNNSENGVLLNVADIINVSNREGYATLRFNNKTSCSDITFNENDKITIICEPNGLVKLYVNGVLACSVYNGDEYCAALENAEIILTDKVSDMKVLSKALNFNEI